MNKKHQLENPSPKSYIHKLKKVRENPRVRPFNPAFTLIELLVVISIIGILVAIGTVSYRKTNQLSRDSRRKADLEQVRQALETYRSENNKYPNGNGTISSSLTALILGDYIETLPSDPKSGYYYYYVRNSTTTYSLCAYLETGSAASVCGGANCEGSTSCNWEVNNP